MLDESIVRECHVLRNNNRRYVDNVNNTSSDRPDVTIANGRYFDGDSQSCQRFSFSGCGNGNRFSSRYQCELRCLREKEDSKDSA